MSSCEERSDSGFRDKLLKWAGPAAVIAAGFVGYLQAQSEPDESHLDPHKPARIVSHQILAPHVTLASVKPPTYVQHPREFYLVVRQHEPGTYSADAHGDVLFPQKVDADLYRQYSDGQAITLADPGIQKHLPEPLSGDGQGVKGVS